MSKNIVFCADGTWNHPGETEDGLPADTNVYKFAKALLQTAAQEPHYDDGVGSDGMPVDRLLGGAIGQGLFQKIKDGYTTIARSFDDGDNIFLFGFSRGAYTARSLAGMIAVCGLPAPGKFTDQATLDAFSAYRDVANRASLLEAFFKAYDVRAVKIAVVGVWDTVGALGIPGDIFEGLDTQLYGFLDTALHPNVASAFHALSIDERRREFVAALWDKPIAGQQIDQVWFPGVHCDVGGGYATTGLSDITMGWMMKNAADRGLVFDPKVFAQYTQLDPKHALDEMHDSWNPVWGFPKSRTIVGASVIANDVAIRIDNLPAYRPLNLPDGFPKTLGGMTIENVVRDPPIS
jgi:uncharacterized protein (DUF2235 family)